MNIETKEYSDGTTATGVGPLPNLSPAQQDADSISNRVDDIEFMVQTHATEPRLDRLIDHVNREIGVAQETPLCQRVAALEALCEKNFGKIKELTKLLN